MISADDLLAALSSGIEPRLRMSKYEEFSDDAWGYDCCGCATVSQVYEDIVAIITRLSAASQTVAPAGLSKPGS